MSLSQLTRNDWSGTSRTPLNGLDLSLAQLCHSLQPSDDLRHRWLAALVSHQWGRGHACLDLAGWPQQAAAMLDWTAEQLQALPDDLAAGLHSLPWTQGDNSPLVCAGKRLYLRRAWLAEQTIKDNLTTRLQQSMKAPAGLQQQLDTLFGAATAHTDRQRQACAHAAQHAVTLITGGPGTGKTNTVVKLLQLLQADAQAPLRVALTAPTGKAAARLSQTMAQARNRLPAAVAAALPWQAQTLHRWLLAVSADSAAALPPDVVVIDEASMIDLEMMARVLQSVPLTARLVLLGDKDQLASVEAGAVMAQLCQGKLLSAHTVSLLHSHRFDDSQGIGQWARAANSGDMAGLQQLWQQAPEGCFQGNAVVSRLTAADSVDKTTLAQLTAGWQPWLAQLSDVLQSSGKACDDEQALALLHSFSRQGVLCAVRDGRWGVHAFNRQLQQALGFPDTAWYSGRPVMARRNDYALGIMNGDSGLCLPRLVDGAVRLCVAFADAGGGVRWQVPGRLDDIDTVFAMTVHQSQGSEFELVMLVLPERPAPILTRELIYTGITRARRRLCVWAAAPGLLFKACGQRVQRSGGLQ
ncbi:MAG: exodeoxyribonuclease V subunit alpha [Limnohabitans sp.]|nr:exodeoxyribonuclease V subunit alpha [Limnohabitans sp.]